MIRSMSKRKLVIIMLFVIGVFLNIIIFLWQSENTVNIQLQITVFADKQGAYKIYYGDSEKFTEEQSMWKDYIEEYKSQDLLFLFPDTTNFIRIDLPEAEGRVQLSNLTFQYQNRKIKLDNILVQQATLSQLTLWEEDGIYHIETEGGDPYILLDVSGINFQSFVDEINHIRNFFYKVFLCFILDGIIIFIILHSKKITIYYYELYENRKLIWKLAKNDFKTKFAGSYLGIIWAFIQPIVTILVYWFVFQVGLKNGNVGDVPFALWLMAGLIPWFFFSESLNGATNSMIEYNYLVKKVVFQINILPVIKMLSAFFVHIFFVLFMLIIYACNGYAPDFYTLQVVYYSLCMFVFVLGLSYLTSAIVVFMKDLTQLINIVLQIGVWMTPIMWDIQFIPEKFQWIFKINPMYYIVQGYRDSLINKAGFYEHFGYTLYYWVLTIFVFWLGTSIFKKLKRHFADLL